MRNFIKVMSRGGWIWWIPALLAVLVHLPVLTQNLIWDDAALIMQHPRLADPRFLLEIFANDYGTEIGSAAAGYYRPFLVLIAFVLRHGFGVGGLAYHLVGLICLAVASTLVGRLMLLLLGERGRLWALMTGCLYAVHPARAEVAALFTSLPDLLIELFILCLMVQCAVLSSDGDARQRRGRAGFTGALGLLFALLAGLSKEGGLLIVPGLLVIFIVTHAARKTLDRSRLEYSLFALGGSLLAGLCRYGAQIHGQHPLSLYLQSLFGKGSASALVAAGMMVRDVVVPAGVVFIEDTVIQGGGGRISSLAMWVFWAAYVLILLVLMFRGRVLPALLWAWGGAGVFLLMLTAVSSLPYAQRYIPLAPVLVGGGLLCRAGFEYVRERGGRSPRGRSLGRVLAGALGVYLLVLAGMTAYASFLCRDVLRLMSSIAKQSPDLAFPHTSLARLLYERGGDWALIERHAREALILAPDDPQVRRLRKILAKAAMTRADYPLALEQLDRVAVDLPEDPEIPYLKAVALANLRRWDEAMRSLTEALARQPDHPEFIRLREHLRAGMKASAKE
jgi:hypothetical protein